MARIYQTVFPVNNKKTLDDFAGVITTWIAGSPHRRILRADLTGIGKDSFKFSKNNVNVESARYNIENSRMYGVRLVERTDALRTTDVVGHISNAGFNVSVSHEYEAQRIGNVCNDMSKPRIVKDVISALGGGYDGSVLLTKSEPHFIEEDAVEFVAEIINNESNNKLPVIYISRSITGTYLAHPGSTAFSLGGMAHVLVEPSVGFSYKLRMQTNSKNTYGGAVGIHWPNGMQHRILPGSQIQNIEKEIYDIIKNSAIHTMVPESLTFDGIRMVQTAKRIEQLRAEHEAAAGKIKETRELLELTEEEKNKTLTEFNELLELSSRENQLLRKQNEDLTAKNWSLESKLVSASGRKVGAGELVTAPNTVELYNGENSDIILAALKMYANHVPNASRRQDIVNAIIDANKITGKNEELREAVERIFRQNQSGNYTEAMGNALRALGFAVEKLDHPKIYVPGHEQKMLKIAGTPSDTHTRNNEAKDVKNKLL